MGAGISGVAAARELRQWGHRCLLVEATDHIGGRILTLDILVSMRHFFSPILG